MSKSENGGAQAGAGKQDGASGAARASGAGLGAFQSMSEQVTSWEREMFERMKTAASDALRLYGDALDYAAAMSAQWRAFYLDAARRAHDVTAR